MTQTTARSIPPLLFLAGGTGGHIHPCLAIAERAREVAGTAPRAWVVCSQREIDAAILRRAQEDGLIAGYTPTPASPFIPRLAPMIKLVAGWGRTVAAGRRAIRLLREAAGEQPVVISTGGFVAPAGLHAAGIEGCRRVIIGLDAVRGRALRWAAASADDRFDAAHDPHDPHDPHDANHRDERSHAGKSVNADWKPVGPIVRRDAMPFLSRGEARTRLGLDAEAPTLLVIGGSQGARTVNEFLAAHVDAHADAWREGGWQAVHLTGADDRDRVAASYREAGVRASVHAYFEPIGIAWSAATLHIGRSGAGGVAEARTAGVMSVFMPYPFHKDMHQRANAEQLVQAGRAVVFEDQRSKVANLTRHGEALAETMRVAAAESEERTVLRVGDGAAAIVATLVREER